MAEELKKMLTVYETSWMDRLEEMVTARSAGPIAIPKAFTVSICLRHVELLLTFIASSTGSRSSCVLAFSTATGQQLQLAPQHHHRQSSVSWGL
jgi:hypothetical protein